MNRETGKSINILLLEEDLGDIELVREMLSCVAGKCTLITAGRLAACLSLLKEGTFDVLLLNLRLHDSSGIETLWKIQDIAPNLPIVVLAESADEEFAAQALGLGAQDYLVKGKFDGPILSRSMRYAIERSKGEEALRESEARLYGIASAALDAVIMIDNDGLVTFWNDAATSMFGYTKEEITGKYLVSSIMPDRHIDAFLRGFEAFRLTGEGPVMGRVYEIEAKRKDWTEFPVELSLAALRLKGKWNSIGIVRDITARKRLEVELRQMAHHDALTGLPNRRLFIDILDLELAETRRHQNKLAVLFLDLDRFKHINDTLGHDIGDELLKEVAERLRHSIRESDTVARIGGDEFNILLADIANADDISGIAKKIVDAIKEPFWIRGHQLHSSTSIGISIYPDDADTTDALFKSADIAMYHAKRGGSTCQFYSPSMNVRSIERMRTESWLRQAIRRGELEVYYQPQVAADTRQVFCAEALVRWNHPEQGVLTPKHFIPLAEETGFITAIDEWVLRTACAQFRAWQEAGLLNLSITVNLSAKEFQRPDIVDRISLILQETGLEPKLLELEITESVAMKNPEHTIANINRLAEMGVHISIDDFGTGYSSLSYMKRLPIQKLKIDQSFIRDIATDPDDRAIITAVTSMAHSMNMKVIAEGVETEDQLSFLIETHCDEAQGYLFSRPLPAEEFRELVEAGR
jgi:diguanylate cyclase (GGDEF)-like protein/PAS domain S-box-containing protein